MISFSGGLPSLPGRIEKQHFPGKATELPQQQSTEGKFLSHFALKTLRTDLTNQQPQTHRVNLRVREVVLSALLCSRAQHRLV